MRSEELIFWCSMLMLGLVWMAWIFCRLEE